MTKNLKVLIADDHEMLRRASSYMLKAVPSVSVIGEASNGEEVLDILKEKHANIVLMDIDMPKLNGFDTAKLIKEKYPFTNIIILSMLTDTVTVKKMLKIGVSAYITKNCSEAEFYKALETVSRGEKYIAADLQSKLLNHMLEEENDPIREKISERELEIIKLISKGLSSKEIGDKLFISVKTVESHRRKIYKKLDVKNVAKLLEVVKTNSII